MSEHRRPVIIIGAGVSGLVLAQGLKHRNIPFILYEKHSSLSSRSQGYRFRVVEEGLQALERTVSPQIWDILDKTHPAGSKPDLLMLNAITAETKHVMDMGSGRCWPIDRPWFREVLHMGIESDVVFNKTFQSYSLLPHGIIASFTDGTSAEGRMIIAADGIHSLIRKQFLPDLTPMDLERTVLWGRTPLNFEFERRFGHEHIWSKHFAAMTDPNDARRSCLFAAVRWPNNGDLRTVTGVPRDGMHKLSNQRNYVFWALCSENPPPNIPLETQDQRRQFSLEISKGWDKGFRTLFEMQEMSDPIDIISHTPDIPVWDTDTRITFMGDALHAMTPTGGSGGLTAIQDAAELADVLGSVDAIGEEKLTAALRAFEDGMRARAKKAIEFSYQGAKFLWAGKDWWEYEKAVEKGRA